MIEFHLRNPLPLVYFVIYKLPHVPKSTRLNPLSHGHKYHLIIYLENAYRTLAIGYGLGSQPNHNFK